MKNTEKDLVEWPELKTGVFCLQEQAGCTAGGRGILVDKSSVLAGPTTGISRTLALGGSAGRVRTSARDAGLRR